MGSTRFRTALAIGCLVAATGCGSASPASPVASSAAVAATTSSDTTAAPSSIRLIDAIDELGFQHRSTIGVLVADLDTDADLDVLIIKHQPEPEALWRNDAGIFTEVPFGEAADRHECDAADINADGLIDVYCSVGADAGDGSGANNLYIQQRDGTYLDEAASWNVTDPTGRGRDVVFLHANDDLLPDLFVSNWGPRDDGLPTRNQLFINQLGETFVAAPEFGVDEENRSTCAHTVDFNGDGLDDLVVCAEENLRMFQNTGADGFVDVAQANGFTVRFLDVAFGDIDGDGDLDFGGARGTRFETWRLNRGVVEERLLSLETENGRFVASGDLDNDGLTDFFYGQKGCREIGEPNLDDIVVMGRALQTHVVPAATGCGNTAVAFDHDGDGADGFLVLNGLRPGGPMQFIVLE